MDFRKAILYGALIMLSWNLWTKWQEEHQTEVPVVSVAPVTTPTAASAPEVTPGAIKVADDKLLVPAPAPASQIVTIDTDVVRIKINTHGGEIVSSELLSYAESLGDDKKPIELLNDKAETRFVAQSGLMNSGDRQVVIPMFSVPEKNYSLSSDKDEIQVPLTTTMPNGLVVTKTFIVKRGSYLVNMDMTIKNSSSAAWHGKVFHQLSRRNPPGQESSMFGIHAYSGAAISDPKKKLYEKVNFADMAKTPLDRSIEGGWAAIQQHYFLAAWIPNSKQMNTYYTQDSGDNQFTIGMFGPELSVEAGQTVNANAELYAGPELTSVLKKIAPGLDKTVDYGWLWFISSWIFWLLNQIHHLIGNWGWSIVLVTVLLKAAFYRLSAAAYRSMARMRELQPRMLALRERYGDDKTTLSQKTMELYRTEKINPLGGCLPILIQIPVFIGLYWVLLESVELRHAPFMFWLKDLSANDPYFVLPILMGLSMLVQQRLNPAPPDPTQAKVMMFLPVIFTGLFLYFPSGLVLYWLVNNVLSIAQQWYIMKTHSQRGTGIAKNKPNYGSSR